MAKGALSDYFDLIFNKRDFFLIVIILREIATEHCKNKYPDFSEHLIMLTFTCYIRKSNEALVHA